MTTLSKKQVKALENVKRIEEHFGSRWFIQSELIGITMHTMKALVSKGFLEHQMFEDLDYYRLIFESDLSLEA